MLYLDNVSVRRTYNSSTYQQEDNHRRQEANSYSNNSRGRGLSASQGQGRPYQRYPITCTTLKKFSEETADPSDIVKKFTEEETGLKDFLKENLNNFDYIELVLLVIGGFCSKNGVTEFGNGFIKIVQVFLYAFHASVMKNAPINFSSHVIRSWENKASSRIFQMLFCRYRDP